MKVLHFYLPSSTLYSLPCSLYLAACREAFSRNSRMEYQLSSKVPLMLCLGMPSCVQGPLWHFEVGGQIPGRTELEIGVAYRGKMSQSRHFGDIWRHLETFCWLPILGAPLYDI